MVSRKGPLQTKLKPRRLPLLVGEAKQLEVIAGWIEEDRRKLSLLCDEMGIAYGPQRFYDLALALARKHCIGFQESKPLGKWTDTTRGYLVVEIERLTADKKKQPGHTVSWAADVLAKRDEWQAFLGGKGEDPGEALRVQYQAFRHDLWAGICRDAFKWHRHLNTVAEWDSELLDALHTPHW